MLVLVINSGSSSLKYRLFRTDEAGELHSLCVGIVSELNKSGAHLRFESHTKIFETDYDRPGYRGSLEAAIASLVDLDHGVIQDIDEIDAVGHRAVHGGNQFTGAVLIDEEVIARMEKCIRLAPLHNPANLAGIHQAMNLLPTIPQVAVFDTAFHQTIPLYAALYALPYELYEEHGIRKYGFHGTSYQFICWRVQQALGLPVEQLRMVVCHLGNGVSVAAVKEGRSVDTSLGFTSVEGAMMGTRCGSLDPGIMLYLMRELDYSLERIDHLLHHESGLLGISGVCNDMRRITEQAQQGDAHSQLAIEMFTYRLKKYIGAYAAAMGGIDALVFTGGIGENSSLVREKTAQGLEFLGIEIDPAKNADALTGDCIISHPGTKVVVAVVPTNEEQMIALETLSVMRQQTALEYRNQ